MHQHSARPHRISVPIVNVTRQELAGKAVDRIPPQDLGNPRATSTCRSDQHSSQPRTHVIQNVCRSLQGIEVTVSETRQYHELFPILVGVGLSLLLLQMLLQATWLRMLP